MKTASKFQVGNCAWIKVRGNSIYPFWDGLEKSDSWIKVLIIGCDGHYSIVSIPEPYAGFICTVKNIKEYKFDRKYLHTQIYSIHNNSLTYYGKVCGKCLVRFDHLSPENNFLCWQCEV